MLYEKTLNVRSFKDEQLDTIVFFRAITLRNLMWEGVGETLALNCMF